MQTKSLSCLLATLFSISILANNPVVNITETTSNPPDCNIPAPQSVFYSAYGSNWLRVDWITLLPPGISHRVKTFKMPGNILVNNQIAAPGVTSLVINGLQPGVIYNTTINAICPDGTESPNVSMSGPEATIVSELVVSGYNGGGSISCGMAAPLQYCEFFLGGLTNVFKVKKGTTGDEKEFAVMQDPEGNLTTMILGNEGFYTFKIDYKLAPPDQTGVYFQIYHSSGDTSSKVVYQLSTHKVDKGGLVGRLTIISIYTGNNNDPGYYVYRMTAGPSGFEAPPTKAPIGNERGELSYTGNTDMKVYPNPFTDELIIDYGGATIDQLNLTLFNLQGQKVVDLYFDTPQTRFTLSVADLPKGMYLLRTESNGEVQTQKVTKLE